MTIGLHHRELRTSAEAPRPAGGRSQRRGARPPERGRGGETERTVRTGAPRARVTGLPPAVAVSALPSSRPSPLQVIESRRARAGGVAAVRYVLRREHAYTGDHDLDRAFSTFGAVVTPPVDGPRRRARRDAAQRDHQGPGPERAGRPRPGPGRHRRRPDRHAARRLAPDPPVGTRAWTWPRSPGAASRSTCRWPSACSTAWPRTCRPCSRWRPTSTGSGASAAPCSASASGACSPASRSRATASATACSAPSATPT